MVNALRPRNVACAQRASRLIGALVSFTLLLVLGSNAAAQDQVAEIRRLYTTGLESYDFFEYDVAEQNFEEAIELAKSNSVRDPIVATVYIAKGILFHARFKDTAPEVAKDKTFDEFVSAVSIHYHVEIPEDYRTDDLEQILRRAREIVPPPSDGGGHSNASGSVSLTHDSVAVGDACSPIPVRAAVPAHPDAFRVYLNYRGADGAGYEKVELEPSQSSPEMFTSEIPLEATAASSVDYYIEVVNRQGASVASAGSRSQPISVTLIGECELPSDDRPIVHILVSAGTGFGLADGEAERCTTTPNCYDDPATEGVIEGADRFSGVRPGMASAPFHVNGEVLFNLMKELQLGLYCRLQVIEFAVMFGAKLRYFVLADEPNRFYTGLGVGYGDATLIVDLGPEFNNFRDIVRPFGPAHIGFNIGYMLSFHENVGLQIDVYTPIHFPEFTFHFDINVGPYFQF